MLASLNIKTIFIAGAVVISALSIGTFIVTQKGLKQIDVLSDANDINYKIVRDSSNSKYHIVQIQQFLTDASLTGEMDSIKEAKEHLEALNKSLANIEKMAPPLKNKITQVKENSQMLAEVGLEMTAAYLKSGKAAGDAIMKRPETGFDARSEILGKVMEDLAESVVKQQENVSNEEKNAKKNLEQHSLILSLSTIFLSILILAFIYRRISSLFSIAEKLKQQAKLLEKASMSVSASSQSLSSSNSQQASATQETAASLEEINSMVQKTSENSNNLESNIEVSVRSIEQGRRSTEDMLTSMQIIETSNREIINQVEDNNKQLSDIVAVISEIGNKTKVINDIVFQTKLLSFNASVEAARAGEQGKGFAVVAEEVGNLATMSGAAAKEISDMLENGIRRVDEIVQSSKTKMEVIVDKNFAAITEGSGKATACGQSFELIVKQMNEVNQISSEITSAISEQVKGLAEISKALGHLEQATQANSAIASGALSTSSELNEQFGQLDGIVEDLLVVVNGA